MVGYDTETPLLGPTLSPQKVKGQGSSIPKDANTAGGETTTKPASKLPPSTLPTFLIRWPKANPLIDNGPPANGPKVTVEKGREERAPPKGVKGDKDGKGIEVGFGPFSSGRVFFSLRHSVKRAGRAPNVRGNRMALKRLQRRWG